MKRFVATLFVLGVMSGMISGCTGTGGDTDTAAVVDSAG